MVGPIIAGAIRIGGAALLRKVIQEGIGKKVKGVAKKRLLRKLKADMNKTDFDKLVDLNKDRTKSEGIIIPKHLLKAFKRGPEK